MKRTKMMWLSFLTIAATLAAVGLTLAWFVQNAAMTTLLKILPPDTITIIPVTDDGSEMTALDLDFREGTDRKDDDGTIHILRPICVKSSSPIHRLEVVHTTNLNELTFQIFPATKSDQGFSYNSNTPLKGRYINLDTNTELAEEEILNNYKNKADVADAHAYPLYWLAVNCAIKGKLENGWQEVTSETQPGFNPVTKEEEDYYFTYYYLEISWLENTKETDLFYIMAQNIAQ